MGFRVEPLGPSCAEAGFSKGDEKVETTGMAVLELELGGEEFKSMGFWGVLRIGFLGNFQVWLVGFKLVLFNFGGYKFGGF